MAFEDPKLDVSAEKLKQMSIEERIAVKQTINDKLLNIFKTYLSNFLTEEEKEEIKRKNKEEDAIFKKAGMTRW